MEDVIFAGTAGRAAAGPRRGDAHDRQLRRRPADRVHRGVDHPPDVPRRRRASTRSTATPAGCSTSRSCSSDSGIGREMHVIVGQGQLDAMLHAKPEDRRAFIEEAAGVLKHRKRKEKALRKLDAMQANLNRLTDLTAELRRQLKPLGRQAEVARRAAGIQADLRDARLRLLADDLHTLRTDAGRARSPTSRRCGSAAAGRGRAPRGAARLGRRWRPARRRTRRCSPAAPGHLVPAVRAAGTASRSPSSWPPSGCGTSPPRPTTSGPAATPSSWSPRPTRVREQEARAARAARPRTRCAWPRRSSTAQELERQLAAAEAGLRRRGASAHRRPARGPGQADRPGGRRPEPYRQRRRGDRPARRRARRRAEPGRRRPGRGGRGRGAESTGPTGTTRTSTPGTTRRCAAHDEAAARGRASCPTPSAPPRRTPRAGRPARRRSRSGLRRKDGAGALLAAADKCRACSAALASLLTVEPGLRGGARRRAGRAGRRGRGRPASDERRRGAARCSRSTTPAGPRCSSAAAPGEQRRPPVARPALPAGARWAPDVVDAPDAIRPALDRALRDVVVVDLDCGRRALVAAEHRSCARSPRTATCSGAHARGRRLRPGDRAYIEVQAAVDEAAAERRADASDASPSSRPRSAGARAERRAGRGRRRRPPPSGAAESERNAAVAERLAELGAAARVGRGRGRAARRRRAPKAEAARESDLAGLAELEERLAAGRGRPRSTRSRTPPSATASPRGAAGAARTRWRSGWPCVPPRSGSRRSPGRPTRCCAQADAERQARERAAARAAPRPRARDRQRGRARRRRRAARVAVSLAAGGRGPRRRPSAPGPPARPSCRRSGPPPRLAASWTGSPTRCTATRWPAPSSGCASSSWRPRPPRTSRSTSTTLIAEYGPDQPVPPTPSRSPRPRPRRRAAPAAGAVRPADPGEAGQAGRTRPRPARQGEPAGAGGVRGAGGAAQVPLRPARGPQGHPQGPARPWSRTSTTGSWRCSPPPTTTRRGSSRRVFPVLFPGGEGRLVLTDPTTC